MVSGNLFRMLPNQIDETLSVLANHGVRAWLDTGTLLGLMREGRILYEPDSDDIDISLWEEELPKLRAALRAFETLGYEVETWSWKKQIFKYKLIPSGARRAYVVDFKIYRRAGESAWTPLVSHRTPPTRPLWWVWSKLRKRVLSRGRERHLERWPLALLLQVHTFWVRAAYFDDLIQWEGSPALIPKEWERLLTDHYGNWGEPVHPWLAEYDDGTVRLGPPETVIQAMNQQGRVE